MGCNDYEYGSLNYINGINNILLLMDVMSIKENKTNEERNMVNHTLKVLNICYLLLLMSWRRREVK